MSGVPDDALPNSDGGEVVECGSCGEFLTLCRCKGRCEVCLEWKEKCKCKGRPRPGRPGARRAEWLCFECEEPLEYCQCNNRVWENLAKGIIGIKDPRKRRKAQKALVALMLRAQQRKVNPGGAPIDYSEARKPPSAKGRKKWPKTSPPTSGRPSGTTPRSGTKRMPPGPSGTPGA